MPTAPPLEVWFVPSKALGLPGLLGVTTAPGILTPGGTRRDLEADLSRLRNHYGVEMLVTLCERAELRAFGIDALLARAGDCDLDTDWVAMPAGGVNDTVTCTPAGMPSGFASSMRTKRVSLAASATLRM